MNAGALVLCNGCGFHCEPVEATPPIIDATGYHPTCMQCHRCKTVPALRTSYSRGFFRGMEAIQRVVAQALVNRPSPPAAGSDFPDYTMQAPPAADIRPKELLRYLFDLYDADPRLGNRDGDARTFAAWVREAAEDFAPAKPPSGRE